MTGTKIRILRVALATVVGVGCLFVSENALANQIGISGLRGSRNHRAPSHAHELCRVWRDVRTNYGAYGAAVVAHPVYPAAVYAAPVYGAPVYVAPVCAQVVNAYGQIVTVCR